MRPESKKALGTSPASLQSSQVAAAAWDGVKFWLHRDRQILGPSGPVDDGATSGYTAEVALDDGKVSIQKFVSGNYYLLSSTPIHPFPLNTWKRVSGVVRNADGAVMIKGLRDGLVLVEVTDTGPAGGPPLRGPGRLGCAATT